MRALRGYFRPSLLGRKAMASLLAASRKNFPAACGLHARTKPVRLGAASLARLICALWQNNLPSITACPTRELSLANTHTGRSRGLLRIIKCTCLMQGGQESPEARDCSRLASHLHSSRRDGGIAEMGYGRWAVPGLQMSLPLRKRKITLFQ
jgi:hypothetical protein